MKLVLFLIIVLFLIRDTESILLKGTIKSFTPLYKYVGKFCFEKDGGTIEVNVDWRDNHHTNLYLYSDNIDNVVKNIKRSSCENFLLKPDYVFNSTSDYSKSYTIAGQRNRYWYFVFADCTPGNTAILNYEINLKNNGNSFINTISADLELIPQTHFVFMSLYGILLIVLTLWIIIHNKKGTDVRVFYYIFLIILLFTTSLIIHCISWIYTLNTNTINKNYIEVANWIGIIAINAFYLLLILIGSGWSTSVYYGTIIKPKIHFVVIFMTTAIGLAMSNISNLFSSDIDNYIYFLDTIPGYIVLVLYFIITVYFITCNIVHYKQLNKPEDEIKRRFFRLFTPLFAFYFLSPIMVVICSHFVDPWNRYKTIVILNLCINTLYILILLLILRPFKNPLLNIIDTTIELKEASKNEDIENNNNKTKNNNTKTEINNINNLDENNTTILPFEKGESNKKHKYSKELN